MSFGKGQRVFKMLTKFVSFKIRNLFVYAQNLTLHIGVPRHFTGNWEETFGHADWIKYNNGTCAGQ